MSKIILVQDIIENKIALEEAREMAINYKGEIFEYWDEGLSRYVFVNKDKTKVIKLHKQRHGGPDWNQQEVDIYNNASNEHKSKMAKTELNLGFIEQEFVTPIKWAGIKLTIPQILFANRCRNEVGWNRNNELVCFDLDEYLKY